MCFNLFCAFFHIFLFFFFWGVIYFHFDMIGAKLRAVQSYSKTMTIVGKLEMLHRENVRQMSFTIQMRSRDNLEIFTGSLFHGPESNLHLG